MSMIVAGATSSASATGGGVPASRSLFDKVVVALSYLLLLITFGFLMRRAAQPLDDPDTWWHLRLGEEFQGAWSLSDPGQLSPFADKPWMATQWLPEVVAHRVVQAFGYSGIMWLTGAVTLAIAVVLFLGCRRSSDLLPAALATVLAIIGTIPGLNPRPQVISFLLLAVVLFAWLRTTEDLRPRWWLIALTWVWACSHGMWFLAPATGIVVVLGMALDRIAEWRSLLKLAVIPLAGLVAAALTPVGPMLLMAATTTRGAQEYISEWQPPSFRDPAPMVVGIMVSIVVLTWARRGSRVPWSHVLLLLFAVGWTVMAARTVALGAILVAPLFAVALQSWLPSRRYGAVKGRGRAMIGGIALVCLLGLAAAVPSVQTSTDFPESLNPQLASLPRGTVVFNEYFVGGWLEWRHRNVAPVIDGMTHAYEPGWVGKHVEVVRLNKGWYDFIEGTGAEYALLDLDSPLALELEDHMHWREVGVDRDARYVLLKAPAG